MIQSRKRHVRQHLERRIGESDSGHVMPHTSSTAQGGGSFKNRKPIGECPCYCCILPQPRAPYLPLRHAAPKAPSLSISRDCVLSLLEVVLVRSVKQSTLRRLRVHCVTLLTWLLGGRAHPSWFTVECLQVLRHGVKLWGRSFTEPWNSLLVRMVWQWVGHVLRQPESSLTRSVLLGLQPALHQRRLRTGPNNSGHRPVLRYLQHRNIPLETATDKQQWRNLEEPGLRHNEVCGPVSRANVFAIACDKHMRRPDAVFRELIMGNKCFLPCDRCWGTMLLGTWSRAWLETAFLYRGLFAQRPRGHFGHCLDTSRPLSSSNLALPNTQWRTQWHCPASSERRAFQLWTF